MTIKKKERPRLVRPFEPTVGLSMECPVLENEKTIGNLTRGFVKLENAIAWSSPKAQHLARYHPNR